MDPTNPLHATTKQYVDTNVATANHNVGRNLIHNPLFNIIQRGRGPFTTNGFFADRWQLVCAGGSRNVSMVPTDSAARAGLADESARMVLTYAATGGSGANDYEIIQHVMEDVYRLAGKTVTISFYAASSIAGRKLGISLAQLFGSGGSPSPVLDIAAQVKTLNTWWERHTLTFTVPSISSKTVGTTGDDGTGIIFWLSSGSTNNPRAGNIGVQSYTLFLWGVQLEVGNVATPLEKISQEADLANCQRFFQLGNFALWGYNINGAVVGATRALVPIMRAAPTVALFNINTALTNITIGPASSELMFYGWAGASQNQQLLLNYTASAEL